MGRYGRELSARHEDPAGKYLDAARQRRKDHRSGQTRPEAPIEWPVADLTGGFDAEAVSRWLKELEAGGRLAFRGLEKEQRAVVHRLAHQLGFINTSKADPEGCSARMVCVLRPHTTSAQPPSAESASAEVAASSRETRSAFVAGPPTSPPARRWRRSAVKRGGAGVGQETPDARLPLPVSMPMQEVDEAPMTLGTLSKVTGSLCIVWLRDDLRLQDNEALLRSMSFSAVVPVFILEEPVVEAHGLRSLRGAARFWKHESLRVFSKTLASLGSGLILRVGGAAGAEAELLKIWQELGAPQDSTLAFNRRCERWQQSVDEQCSNACRRAGLKVESFPANVLYEPQDLQPIERWQRWRARVRAASGEAGGRQKGLEHLSGFGSYRFLAHALEELGLPAKPLAAVVRLPPLPVLRSEPLCVLGLGDTRGIGFTSCRRQSQPGAGSHRDWARGIRAWWRVGEEAAQERLKNFLEVLARGDFEGRKRLLSDEKNTSELSPYLRFGEISARFVYWAARSQCAQRTEQKIFQHSGYGYEQERPKANATFLRRFMWRDLAYWFLWEFPSLPHTSLRLQYEEQAWNGTDVELKKWQKGVTGFPLVDAAMRQLWHVGWMPNYVRHVVAQMLIEYLDISWKHGLDWFDWTLVDADVAINSFMWQNGGHSGPDQWEFVLHPVNAAKSCDPLGTYVRRWVPELRSCPAEWIHRPWEMPLGRRTWIYLEPMIKDLDEARRRHCRNVLEVRRRHPETIARNGHEWLKLPGRKGLLAKLVTRQEFRADTEDFIFYQSRPKGRFAKPKPKPLDDNQAVLAEHMEL